MQICNFPKAHIKGVSSNFTNTNFNFFDRRIIDYAISRDVGIVIVLLSMQNDELACQTKYSDEEISDRIEHVPFPRLRSIANLVSCAHSILSSAHAITETRSQFGGFQPAISICKVCGKTSMAAGTHALKGVPGEWIRYQGQV